MVFALGALWCASATQVMQRPADYKDPPREFAMGDPTPQLVSKRADGGYVQAAYFTNWGIYGANFQPSNITPSDLTHILYAFADVSASTGLISLTDTYADEQKHYPGDSWDATGNNLYGCLKQMYLLKLANRNLKVLLSVGGYTYSQEGHFDFVTDASLRAAFVNSSTSFIENFGFDGIDIDFEYANTPELAAGFADLLTEMRTAFDALATEKGDSTTYQLTIAAPAGYDNYQYFNVKQMDAALTYWNLMAYDYAGSWLNITANQANVYDASLTNVSTDVAVQWYLGNGVTASKMTIGIPLYGRAFEDTKGLGDSYDGVGPGTIQAGIYSYSALPLAGATVTENQTSVASYSYDSSKEEFVSYDTPTIANMKAQYVMDKGLAGSMFWDLSTDKTGDESLVYVTSQAYGSLDQTQNHIDFPDSEWTNIADNMGESNTTTSTTTATTTTSSATTTSSSSSSQCASVSAWSSGTAYTGGQTVTYSGDLWSAKWWTEDDTPGGSAGVWTDEGAC
ncbi:hypothetical protein FOMPIDRAFT_40309 [Fomitopsis schrenkii]|uniref:GH18 domain-containing protein n=1 Tax=Fomitopsis schrenkii TaxID=2126942 RepID=S8FD57_FOMSC|nr:hypothetical protein FOMPIDRAFT_40309 [Fomitopsis schrenkii]